MKDIRQTSQYANYMQKTGWLVEKVDGVYYFIKNFPIIGAFIKIQRPEKVVYKDIEKLTKKYRAFQIVIEPKDNQWSIVDSLWNRGYRLSKSPFLPTKTLILDLTKSQRQLFKNLKKDARYSLRKSGSLKITKNPPIISFHDSWEKAANWQQYVIPLQCLQALKSSFRSNLLLLASHNNYNRTNHIMSGPKQNTQFSTGAIFIKADTVAYYWQAFTNKQGRKTLAQYKLVWKAILWARKKGCKVFNFEGVYDERFPNKRWLGFTHFKKSFGGRPLLYPGTFVKTEIFNHFYKRG